MTRVFDLLIELFHRLHAKESNWMWCGGPVKICRVCGRTEPVAWFAVAKGKE